MKLFNTSILFLFISMYSYPQSNELDTDKIEAVDNLFQRWNHPNSPGAAIGIIQNGKMLYSKGYGLANLEHNIPNTSHTTFNIASNSKQFTAACIMLLSKQGKLNLNQSLSSIYPDFPKFAKTISIKNLLNHTSGLRDYPQIAYLTGLGPDDNYTDEDIMRWTKSQKDLNFRPGEKYLYSNSGYWLLGQIVHKVSGISLAEFAQRKIFEPLGMNHTRFRDSNNMIINDRASGHNPVRSGGFMSLISTQENIGDGGVYTSVEDIKMWDDAFYNQNIFDNSFWELMTSKGVLNNGETISYASGLEIKEHNGLKTIDHGGRAPGYWSNIIRFPDQKFTVIVFTNTSNANATPLGYQIADIFLKEKFDTPIEKSKPKRKLEFITLSKTTLKKYEASYWNSEKKSTRKVYLKNDTLMYKRGPGSIHPLAAISDDEFKVMDTPPFIDAFVKFKKNNDNYELLITINGDEENQFKTFIPTTYSTNELQSFIGRYYSEEIDTYYKLELEKEQLWLFINGTKKFPLRHVRDQLFTSPMCDFEFKMSSQKIHEFKVSTPRVKNLSFKRVK